MIKSCNHDPDFTICTECQKANRIEELQAQLAEKENTIDNMLIVNDLHVAQLKMPEDNRWYLEVVTIRRRNVELQSQLDAIAVFQRELVDKSTEY